jgi:pimeloyl-ACP methyl ester carboxylesterase
MYLMGKGYDVLTLDLSGHGDSGRRDAYSFRGWLDDIQSVLNKHEIEHINLLMGHSLGGFLSIGTAVDMPVDKIVLIDPLVSQPHPLTVRIIKKSIVSEKRVGLALRVKRNPRRNGQTIINDMHNNQKWHEETLSGLIRHEGEAVIKSFDVLHEKPEILLVKPIRSMLITKKELKSLAHWRMSVVEIPKAQHGVHLDNFEDFINAVETFL